MFFYSVFFKETATTEIYTARHTLSLHDARPIPRSIRAGATDASTEAIGRNLPAGHFASEIETRGIIAAGTERHHQRQQMLLTRMREPGVRQAVPRSEEHTSELQSLMRISYAVFCLKKKKTINHNTTDRTT